MTPEQLQRLQEAIESAISSGFTNAAASLGVTNPGTQATGRTTEESPPTVQPGRTIETQISESAETVITAQGSFTNSLVAALNGGFKTAQTAMDTIVELQELSGNKLIRDLRSQVGISVRENETLSDAIARSSNKGAQAVGRAVEAYANSIFEFQKFEGLKDGEAFDIMQDMIRVMGDTNINLLHQSDEAMLVNMTRFQNSMKLTANEVSELIGTSYAETGEASTNILDEIANQAKVVGDSVGIPFIQMGEGIRQVKTDMDTFTDITIAASARIVASLSQMGMSISTFKNMMQPFRDFDSAATKMGDLSAMFGVQMDAMEMMYLANEDEEQFLHRMREQLLDQGLDVESMSKTRQRALADSLGMGVKEMKMFMQTGQQVTSMEDLRARSQEASTRNQTDAVEALNETMTKVASTFEQQVATLQTFQTLMTGGGMREISAASGEISNNMARSTAQTSEFAETAMNAQRQVQALSVTALNMLGETMNAVMSQEGNSGFLGTIGTIGDVATGELSNSMDRFDANAPLRVASSIDSLAEDMEASQVPSFGANSWPNVFYHLAVALGSSDFAEGVTQMAHYLSDIDIFSESMSSRIGLAVESIEKAFDLESLSTKFFEAEGIISSGVSGINEEMSLLPNDLSISVPPAEINVVNTGNVQNAQAVTEDYEQMLASISSMIDKFEKEPTEVKVTLDLEQIKAALVDSIEEGFENVNYQFDLSIAGVRFADALKRVRDVDGDKIIFGN